MNNRDLLMGYTVNREYIQSAGNMTLIPITTTQEMDCLADLSEVQLEKDIDYGTLRFQNVGGKVGILLHGWTILTKQPAQDRAVPKAHLLKKETSLNVDARCVQSSQPGLINPQRLDDSEYIMLPPLLRYKALLSHGGYSALWDSISAWDIGSRATLRNFYSRNETRLDEFIAQFEPVPQQVGAMVLVCDQLLSIDLFPTYAMWKSLWRKLIRDSYGAEVVRALSCGNSATIPTLRADTVTDMDSLEESFHQMTSGYLASIVSTVNTVMDSPLTLSPTEQIGDITLADIGSGEFIGQAVFHGDNHCVYMSYVRGDIVQATTERKPLRTNRIESYTDGLFRI